LWGYFGEGSDAFYYYVALDLGFVLKTRVSSDFVASLGVGVGDVVVLVSG
jgi:hypothetical protein